MIDLANVPIDADGRFPLLNLVAEVESLSESSVCLGVQCRADMRAELTPEQQSLFEDSASTEMLKDIGWIDCHYPCRGTRKAFIRMCLPTECHSHVAALADELFQLLSIPADTVRVIDYFSVENRYCILPDDEFHGG